MLGMTPSSQVPKQQHLRFEHREGVAGSPLFNWSLRVLRPCSLTLIKTCITLTQPFLSCPPALTRLPLRWGPSATWVSGRSIGAG